MRAAIVKNGIITNVVVLPDTADQYDFGAVPLPDGKWIGDAIDDTPTAEERVAALEAKNKILAAQVAAQSDQLDFYEDCIAEMAEIVYA